MNQKRRFRLDALRSHLDAELIGDGTQEFTGVSSLADAGPQDLAFYSDHRYREALKHTKAIAVLTKEKINDLEICQLLHPDPFLAFLEAINLLFPTPEWQPEISELAKVSDTAQIADDVQISAYSTVGPRATIDSGTIVREGVHLGADVKIGEQCILGQNAVIGDRCQIGSRVTIHQGAILGADGFGFARRNGTFIKVRHLGSILIEDDVEIGANATIDRGTLGQTIIRKGVKIDNLVHIAHNVEIGNDSAIAAQAGVSGSTSIGKRVLIGGQVGLVDHVKIGDDAVLIAQSGVIGDIPSNVTVSGYPARAHQQVLKATAELNGLTKLRKRILQLEEKITQLEEMKNDDQKN